MPPKCKRPDCDNERMVSATGNVQTYCEEHQREYWREHSDAKHPGKNVLNKWPLNDSIGDNGTVIEAANVAKTSRLSEAEKEEILAGLRKRVEAKQAEAALPAPVETTDRRFKDTYTDEDIRKISETLCAQPIPFKSLIVDTEAVAEPDCAEGRCDGCVYRDVVEMLEKRVPGVRELVDGLKTIQRGR